MTARSYTCIFLLLLVSVKVKLVYGQTFNIRIVNMIPADSSAEVNNDSEPNIAVNPRNPSMIAGSAFTYYQRDICGCNMPGVFTPDCRAPIYLSTNGGASWELRPLLPSNNGMTHDISLAFGRSGSLYAAFLKGCQVANNINRGFMVVRLDNPATSNSFRVLDTRFTEMYDQPWVEAATGLNRSPNIPRNDNVFVGINKNGESRSRTLGTRTGTGKTAQIMVKSATDSFIPETIEKVGTMERNLSGIRVAVHDSGVVYGIFYRWKLGGRNPEEPNGTTAPVCDVVVVKDENFALNATKFESLGLAGNIVASNKPVPISYPVAGILAGKVGNARLVGSNLSIAVDPANADHVYIAWCDSSRGSYSIHCKRSRNGGLTWEDIHPQLREIENAINPSLAIASNKIFGIVYQQLVRDSLWETHFRLYSINAATTIPLGRDYILSRFPNHGLPTLNAETVGRRPSPGEYLDMVAVDSTFYGVFSAINTPDPQAFPTVLPIYNREHSFDRKTLSKNGQAVLPSIDPFFFSVEVFNRPGNR
jgi:hypothetical protein